MSDWSTWARTALEKMREPGWKIRPEDENRRGGASGAEAELEAVAAHGYEPYYTLKAFVCRNGLEDSP